MKLRPLADGVYRLPVLGAALNAFLIDGADGVTIVDTGVWWSHRRVLRAVAALGKQPSRVTRIILTHAHLDHAGAVARLRAATGARILAHGADRDDLVRGRQPAADRSTLSGRTIGRLSAPFRGCEIDETLTDGHRLAGGLHVLHTPGHTPGHVSILHEPTGVLMVGDALINPLFVRYPLAPYCSNLADVRTSAERLADLDFDVAAFAHGPPIAERARERIRTFALRSRSS